MTKVFGLVHKQSHCWLYILRRPNGKHIPCLVSDLDEAWVSSEEQVAALAESLPRPSDWTVTEHPTFSLEDMKVWFDLPPPRFSDEAVNELVSGFVQLVNDNAAPNKHQDLIYRLRKRAEIRRQIPSRKSVQEGKSDRLADLLEEAARALEGEAT